MVLKRKLGYSLIEILFCVAILSSVGAGGYLAVSRSVIASTEVKLRQDVKTVNRAIQLYLAHGGKISRGLSGDDVLGRIRLEAANPRLPGLKGSFIDPRLNIRWQAPEEAASTGLRAYWNEDKKLFVVAESGQGLGVKEFYRGNLPLMKPVVVNADGTTTDPNLDDRKGTHEFAAVEKWVWDYMGPGGNGQRRPAPVLPVVSQPGSPQEPAALLRQLPPPMYSESGASRVLTWYPRDLALDLPQSVGADTGEVFYSLDGSVWERYIRPFPVDPGVTVMAKTVSLQLDLFQDSDETSETYTTTPVTLDLMTTALPSYTYAQLGGPLAPGSGTPVIAPSPQILLANANDIPDKYESYKTFQTFWTWDGSDPMSDTNRFSGNSTFENGYPGEPLILSVANFNRLSTLTLKYVAVSLNQAILKPSTVEGHTITITPTPLLRPLVTPESGSLTGGDAIVMNLDTLGNQTPAGARVFYRTDGIDPGDVNGEPAPGAILYEGDFLLNAENSPLVQVVARVYPPVEYKPWFTISPAVTMTYFLPYANQNVYGVTGGNNQIYVVNPSTGENLMVDDRAAFKLGALALDSARARIYYLEEGVMATGWRLGYLDLITRTHVVAGNVRGSWAYNASSQPQGLAFFNGELYYIHRASDDLIRITLNSTQTAISGVSKVADIRSNGNSFTDVGDLAIDETGLLFFCDSQEKYHRFDLMKMSGWVELGKCKEPFKGMAFYQARLFASIDTKDDIYRLAPATGGTLATVKTKPNRRFVDLAAPAPPVPVNPSNSLWAIDDQSDGAHLLEFRNYRSPLISTAVDYGLIGVVGEGNFVFSGNNGSGINCFAIANDGMSYFARDLTTKVNKINYKRPLFAMNLAGLALGDRPKGTFRGDLEPWLRTMAGTIDPDDSITGLSLSPTGQLYGVLRDGLRAADSAADFLFCTNQVATALTGPTISVTPIGRLTSNTAAATHTEDLVFSRDGALFVTDTYDNEVLAVSPTTASVISILSREAEGDYRGLAIDNSDFRMVASATDGPEINTFRRVDGGNDNDDTYLNYQTRWGYREIEAISFFQAPFLLLNKSVDVFAADGTTTIYGVDFETGQTVPVTDAPYPVRALGFDLVRREVFYLENNPASFRLGSFSVDSFVHKQYGNLKTFGFDHVPVSLPDNLMYFSGYLWYVEPLTDSLIQVQVGTGNITLQKKASNLTGDTMQFDAIGDLAMRPDGWMFFSAIVPEGQMFCRFRVSTMSNFEVISGPTPPPVLLPEGGVYKENWFDALTLSPPAADGVRTFYGSYSSAPSPIRIVDQMTGDSVLHKTTSPLVNLIDFSDQHPGALENPNAVTLQPLLSFKNLQSAYTYADVGGPMMAGLLPPPPPAPTPTVVLSNPNEIKVTQRSSAFFRVMWTYDGIDPRTSPNAFTCADFSGGFPAQPVSVSFDRWQTQSSLVLSAVAKSQQTNVMIDSPVISVALPCAQTVLRDPEITETSAILGVRQVKITPNIDAGDCPPNTRIYYTTDGTDPGVVTDSNGMDNPVTGTLYTGTIPIPLTGISFHVTARVYPPTGMQQWFKASPDDYVDIPLGLAGGHMDIDTSSIIYPFRMGKTDFHVHEYDKKYNTTGASFFAFNPQTKLHNIQQNVSPGTRFKIIVANADLSPGGRLVINKVYNPSDPTTWIPVANYDNTLPSALPVYSLEGLPGTIKLTEFGLYFDTNAIASGNLLPTVTGHVKANRPGRLGEWRNGALTIQAVKVSGNGTDAFKVNTSYSNGGVQGVATSGLLWETTFFHHWNTGPYGN